MNKIFLKTIVFSFGLFASSMGQNFAHAMAHRTDDPAEIVAKLQKLGDPLKPHETVYVVGWADWSEPATYNTIYHYDCCYNHVWITKEQDLVAAIAQSRKDYYPDFPREVISVDGNGFVSVSRNKKEHFQKNIKVSISDVARTRRGLCLRGTKYCVGKGVSDIPGKYGLAGVIVGIGLGNWTLDGLPWVMVKFSDGSINPCTFRGHALAYWGN